MTIDQRTIKLSHQRLVIMGKSFELYRYERPYAFNWPPRRGSASSTAASSIPELIRRADNLAAARRDLRRLITANEGVHAERTKFITYTFAKNVKSYGEAMKHWKEYSRKVRDKFGSQKYVGVVEFQKRGAVHFHVLHFSIPFRWGLKHEIAKLWGHGFIKIKALDKIKSVGAYVSKYLRKGTVDNRLCSKKAYFVSRGLHRPFVIRNEIAIADFFGSASISVDEAASFPAGRLGTVNYSRGKIIER